MPKKLTLYQRLTAVMFGGNSKLTSNNVNTYSINNNNVVYKTDNIEDYKSMLLQKKQQHLLNNMWINANTKLANNTLMGVTPVKMMYRDADLMDWFPEIGAALDIVQEEVCSLNSKGMMVNVSSKSQRIKSIIEDLFINRLDINVMLPMICRSTCKYGNSFLLLNINDENGITGWKELPVYEMERYDYGMKNPYFKSNSINGEKSEEPTTFVWAGENDYTPYKNWQIAHFRLLNDSYFLPYGTSYLNKARRHWRMLSLMEDMMLIYRLERSIERRVYKIYVGNIDDEDVQAYVNQIADNFKRTPIVDPATGQLDLRKNILDVSQDIFIPVRDENAPNPIDTLQAGQNLTAMDDIKFIQNKVLTALRIPKEFLNFENTTGDGKNLSLMDIRLARLINKIQTALLMELTKIATIHLYVLGFTDDLTNFKLTMNNPSSQLQMLEIENIGKKIQVAQTAVSDPGNGIPLMSWTRALREIMNWDDNEISENLKEIRLEKALATELAKTSEIIKKTGLFDPVDRIYGDPNAEYSEGNPEDMGNGGPSGGGIGAPIGDIGDSSMPNIDTNETGEEGEMSLEDASNSEDNNVEEKIYKNKNLISESKIYENYIKQLIIEKEGNDVNVERIPLLQNSFLINEELNSIANELEYKLKNKNK